MVSTPSVAAGSIPAFSACLFHVVPGAADDKTGPVLPYKQIKAVLSNCVHLFGPECNYWIALMYYKI